MRALVIARDGMRCVYCSTPVVQSKTHRPDRLHLDHVDPWAAGGLDTVDNLVVSCARCNLSRPSPRLNVRATRPLVEVRHGRHWWRADFVPPQLVAPGDVAWLIGDLVTGRHPLEHFIREVMVGRLAATGQGEPIAIVPPVVPATDPPRRRRSLVG